MKQFIKKLWERVTAPPAPQPKRVEARIYPPLDVPTNPSEPKRVARVVSTTGDQKFYGEPARRPQITTSLGDSEPCGCGLDQICSSCSPDLFYQ